MQRWQSISTGPEHTRAMGRLLGQLASAGLVVLLSGDLGAGKTCFAQGVAAGLGVPAETPVTSPSYTLLNVHQGRLNLYHFDLYRLSRVDDLADLGYDEFAEGDGLTLVEWADRMTGALSASVAVHIEHLSERERRISIDALDDFGQDFLGRFSRDLKVESKPA